MGFRCLKNAVAPPPSVYWSVHCPNNLVELAHLSSTNLTSFSSVWFLLSGSPAPSSPGPSPLSLPCTNPAAVLSLDAMTATPLFRRCSGRDLALCLLPDYLTLGLARVRGPSSRFCMLHLLLLFFSFISWIFLSPSLVTE